jgi:hypothetical protein
MKKIVILVILLAIGWKLYDRTHGASERAIAQREPVTEPVADAPTIQQLVAAPDKHFTCDGRQHCSQMTSCEEATYFQKNCPGTKMDGDHDGIPCEQQFCR